MTIIIIVLVGIFVLLFWERMENSKWFYRRRKWIGQDYLRFEAWFNAKAHKAIKKAKTFIPRKIVSVYND